MNYSFPATKHVDENGIHEQLMHLQSEVLEAIEAFYKEPDLEIFAGEVMDIYHSTETLIRILEKRGIKPARVRRDVELKNDSRKYYV